MRDRPASRCAIGREVHEHVAISSEMTSQTSTRRSPRRRNVSFLIEALVVLAFIMLALAVFVRLFSSAQLEGMHANQVSQAVLIATNCAEEFSADPTGMQESFEQDGLLVRCSTTDERHTAGTLYEAVISVYNQAGEELYVLETSRYVSDAGGDA